ncbi:MULTISPECIES: D-alanyl-D-alanine carboxypeptidase/D-alanyl-D-alanine-endopeptidase [Spirulina sp. CCY15215]|uniref:D-alanyl-D-alanine carboxypeptidase/D-alanyl-D-alanine endopeptidase n=1 Tax=Spirulina sp. CCY15215 TaxID=2767591 RepID=UPI00195034A7|nr:D-alanyl-D-alanine carboxypeptidase/D-alanyl-D-alanine-endopeptidase [Spirulina major]
MVSLFSNAVFFNSLISKIGWCVALTLINPIISSIAVNAEEVICPAELPQAIEAIINSPEFERSRWGILVEPLNASSLNANPELYALNARSYFVPASNTKLLTTAAVLHKLGADYRIRTPIYITGNPPNLTRLYLAGQGDPSLTRETLQQLARQLRDRGVETISELIVEDRSLPQTIRHPTWENYDLNFYYGAAVNRLILNENTFNLTLYPQELGQPLRLEWDDAIAARQWQFNNQTKTGEFDTDYTVDITRTLGTPILNLTGQLAMNANSDPWGMAVLNPSQYFLDTFHTLLEIESIAIASAKIRDRPQIQKTKREVANIESPPIADLIRDTNQPSNNLYAEALLQLLGENALSSPLNALEAALNDLGVDPHSYQLTDGSGLSRHNFLSPEAIVQTLQGIARSPQGEIYRASLPVAGVSGTLRNRFQNTSVQEMMQAKTGTMTGVSTLSGYLEVPEYQPLVFSIMLNHADRSVREQREAIDKIVLALRKLQFCSY